ncbi:dihydrolipoamide acetyltransferase family protein [Spirillospora sp. NBC_01491]|uniref:dihydrolipoamide acetyltransferase family protein n=1 Tax=Spirillospora sp. NBC_01491 TaxID=2976007 RepID=UPI002E325E56|nr:dihydrolipoamide acetyltransferase family protein [Spirillospora sp. NBC_01491]
MTETKQFKLPDVGEGLTEAEIVKWHVAPGDQVEVNQTIVEIETAKAIVELPCPFEGVVTGLLVTEGETVDVGVPIISVDVAGDGDGDGDGAEAQVPKADEPGAVTPDTPKREPVLVGYGVLPGATKRRPRKQSNGAAEPVPAPEPPAPEPVAPVTPAVVRPQAVDNGLPLAKPPVRKMAKDLGVDLATIAGTGPQGSVTRDDVRAAQAAPVSAPVPAQGVREERIPVKGVRKSIAAAMSGSAFTAPHVTEFLQIDVTRTMEAVRRLRELPDFAEVKVSPLLLIARALLTAVARTPMVNAVWADGPSGAEIVVKHYVNLGIAAATERGLIVPKVKDAQALSLPDLARALNALVETARTGKSTPADLTDGTITITNIGVFGIDTGTPIITPGESAILAVGQIRDMPWVHEGELAIRKVTTLSLSFDHRVIDGELGSRVLRDVGDMLEDPLRMLAWS